MKSYRLSRSFGAVASALAAASLLIPVAGKLQSAVAASAESRLRVVIVGGGTSHDFLQNYRDMDAATLRSSGSAVDYTESWKDLSAELAGANTVIQASNQGLIEADRRRALMEFVAKGGGLVAVHAGIWYNWADWPEYNRLLIGGGTRDHDKPGRFEVTVTAPDHPVMRGVPAHFEIEDELYHEETMPGGAPVEVLATAYSPVTGKTYPSVWSVGGQRGRIVCIALGHDERAHGAAAYRTILKNAVEWTADRRVTSARSGKHSQIPANRLPVWTPIALRGAIVESR